MSTNKCALCDDLISEINNSKEHVIPNAIGGRKKIADFICTACNSKSGQDWDSELAKQLNPLSLFFGIVRERGDVPSQIFETTGGDKYKLNSEGSMDINSPVYREIATESGMQINIKARTLQEAKKILTGVKRKNPQIDIEKLLENAEVKSFYTSDMLKFNLCFGGEKAGRSLVKSTLAMAVNAGIPYEACENALNYLKNEKGVPCFGYYYERDLVINRPENVVFHCVAIKGNPITKQLLGYVELYGIQRMIVCLSENFEGVEVFNSYSIDPISGKEIILEIDFSLSNEDIHAAYNYHKIPEGSIEAAFDKVLPIGIKASYEKEKNRVINHAVEHAFKNCGVKEGEIIMPENARKLSDLIMQKLKPFVLSQFSKKNNSK